MFIHSPVTGDIKSQPDVFILKSFLASGAVPVFFLLSGYLGGRKIQSSEFRFSGYAKEKLHTLVVPFLFWNFLTLSLVFAAKASGHASAWRGNGAYFDVELSAPSIISALCGIGRPPIVYQFWFVRDLIIVSFAAVVVCRLLPKIPLLPWLFFLIPFSISSSLAFYLVGDQLRTYLPPEKFPNVRSSTLYCLCWLLIGVATLLGFISIRSPLEEIGSASFILMLAVIFSATRFGRRIALLGPATFFIYATHEPLVTIVGRTWYILKFPLYGSSFCFLLIPAVVFSICTCAYLILNKTCPRIMAVATGGRQPTNSRINNAYPSMVTVGTGPA